MTAYSPPARARRLPEADRRLLDCASALELFSTEAAEPCFRSAFGSDPPRAFSFHSRRLRLWLTGAYWQQYHDCPPEAALARVVRALRARALAQLPRKNLRPRVSSLTIQAGDPCVVLNLDNAHSEHVVIHSDGWRITADKSLAFRWYPEHRSLPCPQHPAAPAPLARLRSWLNCATEADWNRCLLWLIACLNPSGPYPVLILQGPPLSGTSTAARLLRALVDPSVAPLLSMPFSAREVFFLASRSWILAFDDVYEIPRQVSTVLSFLGASAAEVRRPVLLTTTSELRLRPTLAARSLIVDFAEITPRRRRSETDIWEEFEREAPSVLGALCSAVSTALRRLPDIHLPEAPLLAGAAQWAAAAAPALGVQQEAMVGASGPAQPPPIVAAVQDYMASRTEWRGSPAGLYSELQAFFSDVSPANPRALSRQLRCVAPLLEAEGLALEFSRRRGLRSIRVTHRGAEDEVLRHPFRYLLNNQEVKPYVHTYAPRLHASPPN